MISDVVKEGLVISEEYKFIFLHFYKTGGTSISVALKNANIFKGNVARQFTEEEYNTHGLTELQQGRWVRHLSACEAKRLMSEDIWNSYFKFSFVRNPWDWMVSLYHFQMQDPYFRACHPNFYTDTIKFGGFKPWVKRFYWDRMFFGKFLCDEKDELMVDFVGKYESLQEDFDCICDRVGMSRMTLPHKNKSEHQHYSHYYDAETQKIVRDRFDREMQMFGYKFEQK